MWSLETAQRLAANEDFRALFESEDSPIRLHLATLEQTALDTHATDRDALIARARAAGIRDVWETPEKVIAAHEGGTTEKGSPRPRPVARTRYLRRAP